MHLTLQSSFSSQRISTSSKKVSHHRKRMPQKKELPIPSCTFDPAQGKKIENRQVPEQHSRIIRDLPVPCPDSQRMSSRSRHQKPDVWLVYRFPDSTRGLMGRIEGVSKWISFAHSQSSRAVSKCNRRERDVIIPAQPALDYGTRDSKFDFYYHFIFLFLCHYRFFVMERKDTTMEKIFLFCEVARKTTTWIINIKQNNLKKAFRKRKKKKKKNQPKRH